MTIQQNFVSNVGVFFWFNFKTTFYDCVLVHLIRLYIADDFKVFPSFYVFLILQFASMSQG